MCESFASSGSTALCERLPTTKPPLPTATALPDHGGERVASARDCRQALGLEARPGARCPAAKHRTSCATSSSGCVRGRSPASATPPSSRTSGWSSSRLAPSERPSSQARRRAIGQTILDRSPGTRHFDGRANAFPAARRSLPSRSSLDPAIHARCVCLEQCSRCPWAKSSSSLPRRLPEIARACRAMRSSGNVDSAPKISESSAPRRAPRAAPSARCRSMRVHEPQSEEAVARVCDASHVGHTIAGPAWILTRAHQRRLA